MESLAAQSGEPEDGGERTGDREIGAEIDADQHRACNGIRDMGRLHRAAGKKSGRQIVDEV